MLLGRNVPSFWGKISLLKLLRRNFVSLWEVLRRSLPILWGQASQVSATRLPMCLGRSFPRFWAEAYQANKKLPQLLRRSFLNFWKEASRASEYRLSKLLDRSFQNFGRKASQSQASEEKIFKLPRDSFPSLLGKSFWGDAFHAFEKNFSCFWGEGFLASKVKHSKLLTTRCIRPW